MTVEKFGIPSKHYHVLPAKKLVYQAMVAMPALCLMGLGAKARIDTDTFVFSSPTAKQNAAILAYRDVVTESGKLGLGRGEVGATSQFRKVAGEWIKGAEDGQLGPLQPVSFDDTTRDGVKSEISMRNGAISSQLLYIAGREAEQHQYKQSISDTVLAMRVADVIKYSDYPSMLQSDVYQRRGFRLINGAMSHLSPNDRAAERPLFLSLRPSAEKFKEVEGIEHLMFVEYLRRMHVDPTRIESTRSYTTGADVASMDSYRRTLLASAKDDTLPAAEEMATMARSGEDDVNRMYSTTIKLSAIPK